MTAGCATSPVVTLLCMLPSTATHGVCQGITTSRANTKLAPPLTPPEAAAVAHPDGAVGAPRIIARF